MSLLTKAIAFSSGLLLACGCTGPDDDASPADDDAADDDSTEAPPDPAEDWDRDIISTALSFNLTNTTGAAVIVLAAAESTAASFSVTGLDVTSVSAPDGPLRYQVSDGRLDVGVRANGSNPEITVVFGFSQQQGFDGWMGNGLTFLWPYYCGNLFPCHSDPADGLLLDLQVTGGPVDETLVYAEHLPGEAPSYQLAWASGPFIHESLGTTSAGTEILTWVLPGHEAAAAVGTADLVAAFQWFETALGPYTFGDRAGAVDAAWGGGYGGMEHHPYWHVSSSSMGDATTQIHEAAHGWYGGGVRIECWEDFVLSEGTVSYLTARAIGQVLGPGAEDEVWDAYRSKLEYAVQFGDHVAWPDSCGEVDILEDGLFSSIPYMKGAYFYRAVAEEIGADTLDGILSDFYMEHVGEAPGMQDMLDAIEIQSGFDATDLAEAWLRGLGIPE